MSADQTRILAEIADLLHPLTDSILPDEEITLETNLVDDLGLASIGLAYLSGQIQSRYGSAANLVPLFADQDPGSLTVGEIVRYVARVLGPAGDGLTAGSNGATNDARAATQRPPAPGIHRARNDNAAVLSEYAPGTTRSVLRLPGGEVEVFMAGDGPALILMHPVNVGAGVFARQFASLATRYRLVCMHHPGVGATTWNTDMTYGGIARLARTVLAELSVAPPFHLMGSSFGGIVAQQFSLLHPAECASLVLVGCSYRIGADSREFRSLPDVVREEFGLMYGDDADQAPEGDRAELEELLLRCESMDIQMGLSYLDYFRSRPSVLAQLPKIAVPALILRGRHDSMVTAKEAQVLYGAIPGAQFTELPNAGHFLSLTHPAEVGGMLTPFLEAHTGSAPPAPGTVAAQPAASIRPPDRCGIIISSGRCGSTLLSDLIAEEPGTLSCYEALLPVQGHLMLTPLRELTGAEYWAMLSGPVPHVLAQGILAEKEAAYPDDGRWANDKEHLPPILFATLPKISANPDRLFDVLAARVPQFPSQPLGQHHRMLLDLVAHLEGRRRWVERSGGSSAAAHSWLAACPDANVVYLTRNIADTARSMSKHMTYRFKAVQFEFWVRYGADPYSQRPEEWLLDAAEMPEELRRLMPDQLTVETLQEAEFDTHFYERMVAYMNGCAEQALADLKPRRLLRMRYEDLLADPAGELTRLGDFLGFADPSGWAAQAAGRVRG